jgi:carboxyl-terminal processing protease
MKKLLLGFIVLLSLRLSAQDNINKYNYEDLVPTETQRRVENIVTQFLGNYHFQKFELDDSLSSRIFTNFLDEVDGSRSYFTKADIKNFEKYKYQLDDALLSGDLTFPFMVFNQFRKLYRKRFEYIEDYLKKPLNYDTDDTFLADRSKLDWAKSQKELDKEWNKIILSQAISLKLNGSTDSALVSTLSKRYQRYESRIAKLRSEDVFQSFMNAFTEAIDPHTSYMIPSTAAQFNIDMSQSLEGIGASLRNEDDYVMIIEVVPGGPLFKTQLASKDDYILAVAQGDDGEFQDIVGWLTDDAVKLIRGKKGTVVRLLLKAKDAPVNSQPREIRIVREKIKLEEAVATAEVIEHTEGDKTYKLGVIDIPMFYRDFDGARREQDFQSTTKDVKGFLDDFNKKQVDGVIIDLRNNGGGSLTEAIELTGLFIPYGPVVQRKTGRGRIDVENDTDVSVSYSGPLLVLQNRFSASASEIFAGAIQDYERGLIVGEQSFGKGTVQQLVNLDRFVNAPKVASRRGLADSNQEEEERYGQLKLTTEKFYRVTGNSTQRKGVIPDIAFPSPWDSIESGESSRPTALPYDEIPTAKFNREGLVTEKAKEYISKKYEERLKTDADLIELAKEIEDYKKEREINEFSLNLQKRMKEKEEDDKSKTAIRKLRKSKGEDERKDDLYLIEAQRLLGDLIQAQNI